MNFYTESLSFRFSAQLTFKQSGLMNVFFKMKALISFQNKEVGEIVQWFKTLNCSSIGLQFSALHTHLEVQNLILSLGL